MTLHIYYSVDICKICRIRPKSRQVWWHCSFLGCTTELSFLLCFHSLGFDMREPLFVRGRNKMFSLSKFVFLGFLIAHPHPILAQDSSSYRGSVSSWCVVCMIKQPVSLRSEIQVSVKKARKRRMGLDGWTLSFFLSNIGIISSQ